MNIIKFISSIIIILISVHAELLSLINYPHTNEQIIRLDSVDSISNLPFALSKKDFPIVYKMEFNFGNFSDPVFFVDKFTIFDRFDIYQGSQLFYSSYKNYSETQYRFLPALYNIVPRRVLNPLDFYIVIYSSNPHQVRINNSKGMMLCSYNNTINKLYMVSIYNFIIGVVCIAIGLFSLSLFVFSSKRKDKLNFAFGLMAFINGIYISIYNFIGLQFFPNPIIWWYINFFTYFWIPVTIFFAIEQSLVGKISKATTYFKYLFMGFSFVAIFLDIFKVYSLYFIDNQYYSLFLGIATLIACYDLIRCWAQGSKDARFISLSFMAFALFCILDILYGLNVLQNDYRYFPLGLLIFFILMLIFIEMKFNETQNKIVEYSEELEDLNKNLEKKVEVRTLELNESNQRITEQNIELETLISELSEKNHQISLQNNELEILLEDLSLKKIEIEDSNVKLIELINTKDKFFSIIAHDLKNPLSSIIMSSEITYTYYDRFTKEEQINHIKKQYENANKLSQLLENLLTWARAHSGAMKFEPKDTNINQLILENLELVSSNLEQKSLKSKFDCENEIIAFCDENMIKTCIRNLIGNAIKFTDINGLIEIQLNQTQSDVTVSIKDSGIGMDSATINKLFKLEAKHSQKGTIGESGTGLGLILCEGFIEKHNGKIWVESELGKGSKFSFSIPINNDEIYI